MRNLPKGTKGDKVKIVFEEMGDGKYVIYLEGQDKAAFEIARQTGQTDHLSPANFWAAQVFARIAQTIQSCGGVDKIISPDEN